MTKPIYPFSFYGGKLLKLGWLLPLLPESQTFVDVFGGSGVVTLNRYPMSPVTVYNDIDGGLVNFLRVLRDKPDELVSKITMTPFAREEFAACALSSDDPVEAARMTFVRLSQSRMSTMRNTPGQWAYNVTGSMIRIKSIASRVDGLPEVAERLLSIQIENKPFEDVINVYDTEGTLFYADPPYTGTSTRAYRHIMNDADHVRLRVMLDGIVGKAAVSGYHGLYDDLYSGWRVHETSAQTGATNRGNNQRLPRTEVLWTNY